MYSLCRTKSCAQRAGAPARYRCGLLHAAGVCFVLTVRWADGNGVLWGRVHGGPVRLLGPRYCRRLSLAGCSSARYRTACCIPYLAARLPDQPALKYSAARACSLKLHAPLHCFCPNPQPLDSYGAIVGIEADAGSIPGWERHWGRALQICQWTFAAEPAHPLLAHVVFRWVRARVGCVCVSGLCIKMYGCASGPWRRSRRTRCWHTWGPCVLAGCAQG